MRISRFTLDPRGRVKEALVVDGADLDDLAALRLLTEQRDDSEEGDPVADDEASEP